MLAELGDPYSRAPAPLARQPVGSGGMATAYAAHDLRHDRQLAVKLLKPELSAAIGTDRFQAEIRTTANLQHPNIRGADARRRRGCAAPGRVELADRSHKLAAVTAR